MSAFNLSANIEYGFAKGSQYIVTPNAKRAVANIVDDYHSGIHSFTIIGSYGTGKSSFLLALESDLMKLGKKQYLIKPEILSECGQFEIIKIVGDYVDLPTLLRRKLKLDDSVNNIIDDLIDYYDTCQRQNKVLIFVIDEFGKILEHASKNNPEKELYFLQQFAEFVNSSSRKILLISTLHQNFGAYSKGLTERQVNEWNKVKGRFKEITFVEPVEQLLFLASQQIQTDQHQTPQEHIQDLFLLAQETRYTSDSLSLEVARQLYPLDPFSAYTITAAIQRYGQNERSLFSFLASKSENSISRFTASSNLTYNLCKVFDYISYNFYSYLKDANSDSMSWSAIQVGIERVQGHKWKNDKEVLEAISIIKAIGLLNLFCNAGFKLSTNQLAKYASFALDIKDGDSIIKKLITKKIIRYAEYNERLTLFEGTDVDIEAEIRDARMIVPRPSNFVDELTIYFNKRITPVKAHFYQKGTPRYFDYKISGEPLEIVPNGDTDGYVEIIFSTQRNALESIKQLSAKSDYALVFAYFSNTSTIVEHLYNINLYKYVREKIVNDSDYVAIKEIDKLRAHEETMLNNTISNSLFSYNEDVIWIYKGEVVKVSSHRDFNKLLSTVCNQVYSQTPIMNNELFNKHKLSGSINGAKSKYFLALLEKHDFVDFGFEEGKFPPEKTIYYSLLKNTGLHINGEFSDSPQNEDIKPLWDACENFLAGTREKPKKLSELIKILSSQPYKIKDGFLEFWLPTYLFIKRQDYSLYSSSGQYIPNFSFELFDLMKKHIGEFSVKSFSVDGVKIQLFNQYRKFLRLDDNSDIKADSFIETIKPFIYFYNHQLNEYAKHTKNLPHEETIRFRNVLAKATDPEKAFLEDLPEALGYNDDQLKEDNQIKDYCNLIQRAVRELRGCYNSLIDRIEENLIEKLALSSGDYFEYVTEIRHRLAKVKPHLLNARQKEFYQHAIAQFDNRTEWYQSICYTALDSPLEQLTDDLEPKLHDELVFLFKECEQKAILSERLNYKIDEKEEKRSQELEERINEILTGDNNLDVYTMMRLLQKMISNE